MTIRIRITRLCVAGCLASLVSAAIPADAQPACAFGICIPNELELGVALLSDRVPRASPAALTLGLSFIANTWPLDVLIEGDVGATTREAPECHDAVDGPDCVDGSVVLGPRFRLIRGSPTRRVLPFVSTLAGWYWRGSGTGLESASSKHLALQLGGGFDMQWPESIQGLRVSADYRRVNAYGRGIPGINQFRVMVAYVLNERSVTP